MIIEIQLIAVVVAIACALPGVYLVLRGTSMVADAITHTVLLGIVLAFFSTQNLNSPLLMVGATIIGVVTVWLIEMIQNTKLMKKDAAIGVVFPLFFSIAIILITRYAGNIHLDTDSVLMGELAFAPFNRVIVGNLDLGPQSLWTMGVVLLVNSLFVFLFYKELKLSTFDSALAAAFGFSPVILHYSLMTLVSLTAVGAYDSVGSILVVGFMVGPPVTAYLLTHRLKHLFGLTVLIAIINSIAGVQLAFLFDVTISGMIAVVTGITFGLVFIFSPKKGLVQSALQRKKRRKEMA